MSSSARARCLVIIAEIGAELLERDSGAAFDVSVWTPAGVVWVAAAGSHVLTGYDYGSRPGGWRSLREDLELGVEPCTAVECDTCNPAPA